MKELGALLLVTLALAAVGAGVARLAFPSLLTDPDLDTLYAVGAGAVAIPVLTVWVIRDLRRQRS